jgi:hypothetical protein
MNKSSQHFFARAGLATYQYGAVRRGDATRKFDELTG